jgi:hypothetical protein
VSSYLVYSPQIKCAARIVQDVLPDLTPEVISLMIADMDHDADWRVA